MNEETINQIIETIKTLNLNIDSQTLENIIIQIKPLLWALIIKDMVVDFIIVPAICISAFYILWKVWK